MLGNVGERWGTLGIVRDIKTCKNRAKRNRFAGAPLLDQTPLICAAIVRYLMRGAAVQYSARILFRQQ